MVHNPQTKIRSTMAVFAVVVALAGVMTACVRPFNANGGSGGATPIRAAFYYPWFPETWHADEAHFPSAGQYDSSVPATLRRQVTQARYAGLDAFISSWWAVGHRTDKRLPLLLDAAKSQGFRITTYYEPEGIGNPSVARIKADLAHLKTIANTYGDTWLRVNGKPVIFVYNANDTTCALSQKWRDAASDWYVNLKVFNGYRNCSAQPDSWHQYAGTSAIDKQLPYSATISPGFQLHGTASRLARDPARFARSAADMSASNAKWQLVVSFNEWGEGTAVEPSPDWQSSSGYGTYLDLLHQGLVPNRTTRSAPVQAAPPTSTARPRTTAPARRAAAPPAIAPTAPALRAAARPAIAPTPPPPPAPAPPAGGDVTIVAAGDISCSGQDTGSSSGCAQRRTSDAVLAINPQAVLELGDTQYESGSLSDYSAYFNPTWGRLLARSFPAIGNHEYGTSGGAGFKTYFDSRLSESGNRTYNSNNVGAWHFVALDANCSPVGGCNVGSPQYNWLKADLAANNGRPTVAYWHQPRFSSGEHGDNPVMTDIWNALVADNDVQVVLSGHDHDYERFARMGPTGPASNGLREFVAGVGGKSHYCVNSRRPGQEVFNCASFGVLKMVLHADGSYAWQFVPVSGTFTDSGSEPHR